MNNIMGLYEPLAQLSRTWEEDTFKEDNIVDDPASILVPGDASLDKKVKLCAVPLFSFSSY